MLDRVQLALNPWRIPKTKQKSNNLLLQIKFGDWLSARHRAWLISIIPMTDIVNIEKNIDFLTGTFYHAKSFYSSATRTVLNTSFQK